MRGAWLWLMVGMIVVGGWVMGGEGKRPELLNSSIWWMPDSTVANIPYQAAVIQMEFDQPLYTNGQSFLCPEAEYPCPELTCKPCDWSGQEPTGCDDPTCCGPAQSGDIDGAEAWCDSDGPAYETLVIGETSKRYNLVQGESMYVRFFVPEEYYCRSIVIIPRPYFGTVSSSFSTIEPYPSFSTNSGWRNGLNRLHFGYGQSSVLICPNTTIHPEYNVGTFSGLIYGLVATSFEIEIVVSPQTYPLITPPSNRLSCDDVPDEVMEYAATYNPSFCVEDGISQTFNFTQTNLELNQQLSLVLQIPEGCHTISFSSAIEIPSSPEVSHHLFCLPSQGTNYLDFSNAGIFRISTSGQTIVLTACFEEDVTYLFCSLRIFEPEPVHFSFSTQSAVVRKSLMNIPDASLAMMDGLQHGWAVNFGEAKYPCVDFYAACYDWVLPPSDNALPLFPPPRAASAGIEQVFEDLQEFYRSIGLQEKRENRLSGVVFFKIGGTTTLVRNSSTLSYVITAITNEDGEVVKLPGGGPDSNPSNIKQYSISNWITNIPFSQIPVFEYPECDIDNYVTYQRVVADRLEEVATKRTLDDVLDLKYSLDAMDESVLGLSCSTQVSDNLDTFVTDVLLRDTTDCYYDIGTIEWLVNPCCNIFLSLVSCCLPYDLNITEAPFGDVAHVSECGEPECAQSYYEDLSFSLNTLEDPFLGCTSGIENPTGSLSIAVVEALQAQYLDCLFGVGFGELYDGIFCQIDSDCDRWLGVCGSTGKCVLPSLEEVENQFLACYIDVMPAYLESYLKRNVLNSNVANAPKDSEEFYDAIKKAATVTDCINPNNPLEIDYRTRYQSRPLDYACLSQYYGLEWPEQADQVYAACPGVPCLRSYACLINTSSCILRYCDGYEQALVEATEEDCPLQEECEVNVDGDDCDGSYCVFCPENGDLPCQKVDAYDNEEDCGNGVACELRNGTVIFTSTEEECRNYGEGCTVDCAGTTCESIYKLPGACSVPTVTSSSDCTTYSSTFGVTTEWFKNSLCVLPSVTTEDECNGFILAEWETCQEHPLGNCTGSTSQKQYLGCYESLWHKCENQEQCEGSGMCTDRDLYVTVHSYDPVVVQYGGCIGSGAYVAETQPSCGTVQARISEVGCYSFLDETQEECEARQRPTPFFFIKWVEIATTKEQCLSPETGRRGCQLYQDPLNILLWILEEEECQCQGGVLQNAFEWIPGVWKGGVPRSLEWKEAKKRANHEFKEALSFILLADWIQESAEEQFLFPLQSQIICESVSITSPTNVLLCDCLADGGEVCYRPGEQEKEIQMGLSQVCQGKSTFVKDPSAQISFGTSSISDGCTFLNISLINRNWFSAPFTAPPLSFKWQDARQGGVVLNDNGATVGEVLGDGVVLSFSEPKSVDVFDVCLRLNTDTSGEYDEMDFGYATDSLQFIYPLGMKKITTQEDAGIWYCSPFDFQDAPTSEEGTIRLFPINRLENYEDEEDQYTSDTTRALCYTLGALYCFVGLGCLIGLLAFLKQTFKFDKNLLSLPNFCTFTFLILCIFRAVFMFLYPNGTFEDQPLSYFVIFEIPTFLLFSTLIFMIYSFKKLVYKKGFFPGNPWPILAVGWPLVWGLWVIVTIVYSEVILDDSSGSSPCEGRVEVSYEDEEEDTRDLAIAYQSVIIAITVVLTAVFFYYTFQMYSTQRKKKTSSVKQFVIVVGGSFNISFFARTVLFLIILVADFASSVYLFCTLFFTEILMMIFILVQFNIRYFKALATVITDSAISGGSNSSGASVQS